MTVAELRKIHEPQPVATEELPTDAALERLVNSNIYLMGHGTVVEEAVRGAMEEGLHTRHTDLLSTVHGLETATEDPAALEHDKTLLQAWPHMKPKYVVVLGVERLSKDESGSNRYLESIVQPRDPEASDHEEYDTPYIIGKNFVAGYFDLDRDTFTPNPEYDPTYDPQLLKTTVNLDIQKQVGEQDTGPNSMAYEVGKVVISAEAQAAAAADLKEEDQVW